MSSTQPTISAFFNSSPARPQHKHQTRPRESSSKATSASKRTGSPIDLTFSGDDDVLPTPGPSKRQKLNESSIPTTTSRFFATRSQKNDYSKTTSPLLHAGYNSEIAEISSPTASQLVSRPPANTQTAAPISAKEAKERQRRHEAFKKTLLGPSNPFSRRTALGDARSVEELTQLETEAAIAAGPGSDADEPENTEDGSELSQAKAEKRKGKAKPSKKSTAPEEEEDSDPEFKNLLSVFASSSSKSKGKAKAAAKPKIKKPVELGPSGLPWTPLELQVVELKKANPGTVLMFEVGYKFRFYEEDARIASQELGFVAFPARNLLTASFPVGRENVHLKKLLSKGHRVGVVQQTETAALKKAGTAANTLFTRQLTALYTSTTHVDALGAEDEDQASLDAATLVCMAEQAKGDDGMECSIGWVAISPGTGEVLWDAFDDGHMRTELETRLAHTAPSELLLPAEGISHPSEKMLQHYAAHGSSTTTSTGSGSTSGRKVRIERYEVSMEYTEAFKYLSDFYGSKSPRAGGDEDGVPRQLTTSGTDDAGAKALAWITHFPRPVVIALAHALAHLSTFGIGKALAAPAFFGRFAERTHMLLNANTLINLEIYRNNDNGGTKGGLIWILDKTITKFGARMLKSWVGRPLIDRVALQERLDAVDAIRRTDSGKVPMLRSILKGLPDLARGLARIQYGKITPAELAVFLKAFNRIATTFSPFTSPDAVGFRSPLLNSLVYYLPTLREAVKGLIGAIHLGKAAENDKIDLWTDTDRFPAIEEAATMKGVVETELKDELKNVRRFLGRPALQFVTVLKDEYLIEVPKSDDKRVPADWTLVSSIKYSRRYYPPAIKAKVQERARHMETLAAAAESAYRTFLAEIADVHYAALRDGINKLAVADCLVSLAQVSLQPGYVRPIFCDATEDIFEVVGGRHPMLEAVHSDPHVPNDACLGGASPRSKIITGPNMGGKSSCVRMLALCAIMAQIGAYVPADSIKLSMIDGVLTRMGAFDELAKGRSTFMVEMTETSDILRSATSRSLVILDELGRGTSTFDGMAIADATLRHLVEEVKCKTLFITHYPLVATDIEKRFPDDVQNLHMGFTEEQRIDGTRDIAFLYRLTPGIASGSFGVECGRLASVPESILERAAAQAAIMQATVEERHRRSKLRKAMKLFKQCMNNVPMQSDDTRISLRELKECIKSISDGDTDAMII